MRSTYALDISVISVELASKQWPWDRTILHPNIH